MTPLILVVALAVGEPDPSCDITGSYIGNAISPTFRLVIEAAPQRTWTYTSTDDMFGRSWPPSVAEYRGTYEIDGDLIVFTGAPVGDEAHAMRFGLNFASPGGEVTFNRFLPSERGEFSHHRKWFRRDGDRWLPVEERRLTLALPEHADAETWEVDWKGERIRWAADGTRTVQPVDRRVPYTRSASQWFVRESLADDGWAWLPSELIPERHRGEIVSITWSNRVVGDLRGFHPSNAVHPPAVPR